MAKKTISLGFEINGMDDSIDKLEEALNSSKKLKDELKATEQVVEELSNSDIVDEQALQNAITKANELKNVISKTNAEADEFAKASKFDNVGKSMKGVKDSVKSIDFKDATKGAKSLGDGLKGATDSLGGLGGQLASVPGPLGKVGQGVKALNIAMKALLANPIILVIAGIVAGITALGKAFVSTKEGGEALDRFMAGFSAVMDVLRDVLVTVGKNLMRLFTDPKQALMDFASLLQENIVNRVTGMIELLPALGKAIKLAFSGEFGEAAKVAGDAVGKVLTGVEDISGKVGGVVGEAVDEANRAAELTGTLQALKDEQRDLNVLRAEQNALIAEARLKVDDETLSIEERQKALSEASAAEQQLLDEELRIESARLAALEELAAMSDSDAETLDELANQRIKLANLQEQSTNKQIALTRKQNTLDRESAAEKKKLDDEQAARDKEAADRREAEIAAEQARNQQLIDNEQDLRRQLLLLTESEEEKQLRIIEENYQKRLKLAGDNAELILQVEAQKEAELQAREDAKLAQEEARLQNVLALVTQYTQAEYTDKFDKMRQELVKQEELAITKLESEGATAEQILLVRESFKEKANQIALDESEYNKQLKRAEVQANIQLTAQALGAIQGLVNAFAKEDEKSAKKAFNLNKALSLGIAVAQTAQGIMAQLAVPQDALTGANFVKAGIVAATGAAQIAQISKSKFQPSGGGGTGTNGVRSISTSVSASMGAQNAPQAITAQGEANAGSMLFGQGGAGSRQNPEIRAYVVESDISDTQNRLSNYQNRAEIG